MYPRIRSEFGINAIEFVTANEIDGLPLGNEHGESGESRERAEVTFPKVSGADRAVFCVFKDRNPYVRICYHDTKHVC